MTDISSIKPVNDGSTRHYTPTTEEVFDAATHLFVASLGYRTLTITELNRWLAEVKAQAWEEGFDAGAYSEHAVIDYPENPYRQGETE